MRYPVVNLHRMGGLLEDYQAENLAFKEKLSRMNAEAAARESAARAGQPVYHPPRLPSNVMPSKYDPCPSGQSRSQSPPFDCLRDVTTENPYTFQPGTRPVKPGFTPTGPFVPVGVATGGGTPRPWTNEPPPMTFEVPERGLRPCDPGYSRSPSPPYDCLKDVTTGDPLAPFRYNPPTIPASQQQVTPAEPATQGMVPSGGAPTQPPVGEAVASVDCGPHGFWDPIQRKCRGSVGTIPNIPGGLTSATTFTSAMQAAPISAAASFMGQVPLRANPALLGAPRLTMVPIRSIY